MEKKKIMVPNIKERQMKYFSFDDMPYFEIISDVNEFYRDIYRNYLKGQEKAFLVNQECTKVFSCRTIERFLKVQKKFPRFTPSIYWHHRLRTKEHILWITQITLDFDLTKDGSGRKYNPFQLFQVIRAEFGLDVNYIWETKTEGHYAASFLINPITGTTKSIYLFEAIARRMAILVGADYTAISANNVYTKPKNGTWKFTDKIYDIDDFKIILEDEEANEIVEKQYQEKVTSITEKRIWNSPAIKKLTSAEFEQFRNHAAFTIALLFYALGYSQEDAMDFFYEKQEDGYSWWERVNFNHLSSAGYFPKREIKDSVKSAFSGKYHGPSREWIYMITGEEFPINLYKSSYIKKEDGYISGDETRRRIVDWIRENNGVTIKQEELAESLEVPFSSLKKEMAELKKRKIIDWISQKGKYSKGSTFQYTYEDKHGFTAELDVSYRENGLVDYFSKKMG